MKQTIDYKNVQAMYPNGFFNRFANGDACCFRPAFLVTNEQLYETINMNHTTPRNVLTVAASGDQPMIYAASGATRVDTFDQSFCAKAVMDMKLTAVHRMNKYEYLSFLDDIYFSQRQTHEDLMKIRNMRTIVASMPRDTAQFVRKMSVCDIFSNCMRAPSAHENTVDFCRRDYDKVRQVVSEPFNFIWTDICDLHSHLDINVQYDVINTSNIFEWILPYGTVPMVLRDLYSHLAPGGYIQSTCLMYPSEINAELMRAAQTIVKCVTLRSTVIGEETVFILQR